MKSKSHPDDSVGAVAEAVERFRLQRLAKDCKKCGESSEYAKIYGCPVGYDDCPHNSSIAVQEGRPNG